MTRIKPNEIEQAQRFAKEPAGGYVIRPIPMKTPPLQVLMTLEIEKALNRILGETTI